MESFSFPSLYRENREVVERINRSEAVRDALILSLKSWPILSVYIERHLCIVLVFRSFTRISVFLKISMQWEAMVARLGTQIYTRKMNCIFELVLKV